MAVNGVQMKRGMGIAARKRERQQHDEAAQKQGSLHEMGAELRRGWNLQESRIAQGRAKVKSGLSVHQTVGPAASVASDGKCQAGNNQPLQQRC